MIKTPDLLNPRNSILVSCDNRNFVVHNLATLEKKEIKPIQFYSANFINRESIEQQFLSIFPGKIFIFIREQASCVVDAIVDCNTDKFGTK